MPRTSEQEVKAIIDTALTKEEVTPFVRAANLYVTNVLSGAGYDADTLKEIECWLAAHFVAIRDPRISQEAIGDVSASYDGKTGMGLNSTRYGQGAMTLDHLNILKSKENATRSAELKVLG